MIKQQFSPLVRHGVTYRTLIIGSVAALTLLLSWGVVPRINPVNKSVLIPEAALTYRQWNDLLDRHDIILGLSWQFATNSSGLLLNSDFNIANNNIYCIGSGGGGGGFSVNPCGNAGGGGGGGGAFATIANFNTHGPGFTVSTQCGTGDTWFNSSATVLAKAGTAAAASFSPGIGGSAGASVGTTTFSGGGGAGSTLNGPGGGGGGAAGINGAGSSSSGITGGKGDANNTLVGANGTQFDATHGSGGGGPGGSGAGAGSAGGSYGGGGGGAGDSSSTGGAAFQGLIAISYTPIILPFISSIPRRIVYRRY